MINKWLEKTIIGLDLCPFTRKPFLEGKIFCQELPGETSSQCQTQFLSALDSFQGSCAFETAIFSYPKWRIGFKSFYEFTEDCENHLVTLNLQDEYQLVAFHPKFTFEGLDFLDRGNLVNSSPVALIHVLKISDLDLINLSVQDAEALSFGNSKKLEALSAAEINDHFPWRS